MARLVSALLTVSHRMTSTPFNQHNRRSAARRIASAIAVVAVLCAILPRFAAASDYSKCIPLATPRITAAVDEGSLTTLHGYMHPLARAEYDQGRVDDNLPLEHIIMLLQRSSLQETALATRIDQMHNRRSPYYRKWLTAQDVGGCYGVADPDIAVVAAWLQSHGFKIDTVPAGKMLIIFSGTAGQVSKAFHTEIHNLSVRGEQHIANMNDPQIPAALAPVIAGFRSLHNFFPKPLSRVVGPIQRDPETGKWHAAELSNSVVQKASQSKSKGGTPLLTFSGSGGTFWVVGPQDLYTIYNETPLLPPASANPVDGKGETLAIVQDSDVNPADVTSFRSQFGLPAYPATPNATQGGVNYMDGISGYCSDPGITAGGESEADIDVQWMGTTAPAAIIDFVSCADTATTFGGDLSAPYIINNLDSTVSAFSLSFGVCEAQLPTTPPFFASNAFYSGLWEQAVAEGQTPVVASGDSADDVCDRGNGDGFNNGQDLGETGLSVNGLASTPYNVAAGGTDFSDNYQTNFNPTSYWNSNDTSPYRSALSYIPEIAWNDTCASTVLVDYFRYAGNPPLIYSNGPEGLCNDATDFNEPYVFTTLDGGSGGISTISSLPTWQSAYGVGLSGNFTSTTQRNLPDIAMFASDGFWNHFLVFCQSDSVPCDFATGFSGAGGTSFVAPMFAGIMGLINQTHSRQGQANYTLYALATAEYGTPGSENTSITAPSGYTCEGSNINAISTYGSIFGDCTFYSINRTSQAGSTSCVGASNTGCLVDNNDQPCATGTPGCFTNTSGDAYGILSNSTSTFESAFSQSAGYNAVAGLGSINISNLSKNWDTVTPGFASTTTIAVGTPSIFTTTSTALTATVTATGRGGIAPPLGDVTFYAGSSCTGTAVGSANLVPATGCTTSCNSTASLSVTGAQLGGAGTDSVLACFTGDGANDAPSTSTAASVTVAQTVLTVVPSPSTLSIAGGQPGTVMLAVSANAAISTAVTFACSGLPSDASCAFSTVSSLPANVTMTIDTTVNDAKLIPPGRGSSLPMLGLILPGILLLPAAGLLRRRKKWFLSCLGLLLMVGWMGCGGGSSSSTTTVTHGSQTYTVNITSSATGATPGTASVSVTVTR